MGNVKGRYVWRNTRPSDHRFHNHEPVRRKVPEDLRSKEKEDTAADRAELEANRKTINSHQEEIRLLNQQMQQIPLTVNEELKAELDNLADAKKQIADQEMTEAEAVNFLRQRLNQRRQG